MTDAAAAPQPHKLVSPHDLELIDYAIDRIRRHRPSPDLDIRLVAEVAVAGIPDYFGPRHARREINRWVASRFNRPSPRLPWGTGARLARQRPELAAEMMTGSVREAARRTGFAPATIAGWRKRFPVWQATLPPEVVRPQVGCPHDIYDALYCAICLWRRMPRSRRSRRSRQPAPQDRRLLPIGKLKTRRLCPVGGLWAASLPLVSAQFGSVERANLARR